MSKIFSYPMPKEDVEKDCIQWAHVIAQEYVPDLLIFIARSGFLFAKPMANVFGCKMIDVAASRPKSETKDKLKKFIKIIPEKAVLTMLSSPIMYWLNESKAERNVELSSRFLIESSRQHKKILIVDDSVDTGWTILSVKKEIQKYFPNAELRVASYTVIEYSRKRIQIDYYRYQNRIILTATSRKSEQYTAFLEDYERWIKEYERAN